MSAERAEQLRVRGARPSARRPRRDAGSVLWAKHAIPAAKLAAAQRAAGSMRHGEPEIIAELRRELAIARAPESRTRRERQLATNPTTKSGQGEIPGPRASTVDVDARGSLATRSCVAVPAHDREPNGERTTGHRPSRGAPMPLEVALMLAALLTD